MPQPFAEHERVAAQDDGDVVIPPAIRPPFVVIEPELALEVLVDTLGAPALLGDAHELLAARLSVHSRERVVRRSDFAVRPFDEQPMQPAVGVARVHLDHGEARKLITFDIAFSRAATRLSNRPTRFDASRVAMTTSRQLIPSRPASSASSRRRAALSRASTTGHDRRKFDSNTRRSSVRPRRRTITRAAR